MKKLLIPVLGLCLLSGCSLAGEEITAITNRDDHFGPYINISVFEYTTPVGHPVDFSNVTGYDDVDGLMPVSVIGYINYNKPGDYSLVISCSDTSGNETQVTVTIHVVESYMPEAEPTAVPETTPEPVEKGCSVPDILDPGMPCNAVLDDTVKKYDLLYEGEEWHQICINAAADTGACEEVFANDGTFWGYGVIRVVEQEEETEESGNSN